MKLDEFLRDAMREYAARELPPPNEPALELDLAREDRRKLLQRIGTATIALVIAFLLAWHLSAGAMHRGGVRIEHHGPTTTLPSRRQATTPPKVVTPLDVRSHPGSNGVAPGGSPGGSATPLPTTPTSVSTPGSTTPIVVPPPDPRPPVKSDDGDMWAIASEARDNSGAPMLVVFGIAPAGHHVTVSSELGTHTYAINDQGDFRWTHALGSKRPAFPIQFHVTCDGCGTADLSVASYDPSPSQPGPTTGFSAFVGSDPAPATFVFGGFEPARDVTTVSLSSPYGAAQFRVRHNTYGRRVTFASAPLNTAFQVDVSAGGQTVHLTVERAH